MLKRGWFDDAVGQVEGRDIFGRLVQSGNSILMIFLPRILSNGMLCPADLRQGIINRKAVDILVNQLETGNRHEVRMSLSYLDILGTFEKRLHLCGSLRCTRDAQFTGAGADCC